MNLKQQAGSKTREEAIHWLLKGVKAGDQQCEDIMWRSFTDEIRAYYDSKSNEIIANKRLVFNTLLSCMGSDDYIALFIHLIDAYREVFRERYIQEINKQLSIHRPSTEEDGDGDGRRHIVVRRSPNNKVGYEIVIILPNGQEIVVDSINVNSMMIYLLAIICSYKSGYSSEMTNNGECRAIIAQLYKMVLPSSSDSEARYFIEAYLDANSKNNYYKTYSYRATLAIIKAIGEFDDPVYYLFDTITLNNRKKLRRMCIDVRDITLPQELVDLATNMPDATYLLQCTGKQPIEE